MTKGTGEALSQLREAAALCYLDDLARLELSGDDAHHLARVLRLRDGEVVAAGDGNGSWRPCRVRTGPRRDLFLEPEGEIRTEPRPSPEITVAFSLLKGERTEWAVEKLTEAGVDELVPLVSERTVVRPGAGQAEKKERRLNTVARQAAMQSRRLHLPRLSPTLSLAEALSGGGARAFLAEPGGGPLSLERPFALVGPEGGWSPAELALASSCNTPLVALGEGVLRAETAAVAAGLLLTALRSGIVGQPERARERPK